MKLARQHVSDRKIFRTLKELRNTVKYLDEGYYSVTMDGLLLDHNLALNNILGFDIAQDLKGQKASGFWQNPEDRAQYLNELMTRGHIRNHLANAKKISGEKIVVSLNAHLVKDEKGRLLRIEGTVTDFTEHEQSEQALRRQAERLQNLHRIDKAILLAIESPETIAQTALQHLPSLLHCQRSSVGILDLEKKRMRIFAADVSDKTIRQTGMDLAQETFGDIEDLRQGKMEIVEDTSGIALSPVIGQIFQVKGIHSYINVPLLSARGLYGALNISWENPKTITPEEIEVADEVARQITIAIEQAHLLLETKQQAEELTKRVEERTAQLEAANKELEAFSYSVSHDLRAPLRAIDGYTRILLDDYGSGLNDEGKRVCNVVSESARNMGKLIDDLLTFSRCGRTALQPSAVDMATMAQSIFFEVTSPGDRERIDFHIDTLPAAEGDPTLLRQVWTNLLLNAVKFSAKKERAIIEVSGVVREGETVYSIRDNGAGFDMKYVDKLFGVFQRLHSTKEFEGTGVGLAIVQRIIHRHGGQVWAEGKPGQGATFYFTVDKKGD